MIKRPLSVFIIARVLIFIGALNLFTTIAYFNDPTVRASLEHNLLPIPVQYAMGFAGLAVMLVSGFAMLAARHWGRVLYVAWTCLSICVGLFTVPSRWALIPGSVIFLVIVFFLFRPAANAFFRSGNKNAAVLSDTPQAGV